MFHTPCEHGNPHKTRMENCNVTTYLGKEYFEDSNSEKYKKNNEPNEEDDYSQHTSIKRSFFNQ